MKNKKTEAAPATTETALTNKVSKWQKLGKQKMLILMSVPFVLYVILFRYIPLWGWTMAFQSYKPNVKFRLILVDVLISFRILLDRFP